MEDKEKKDKPDNFLFAYFMVYMITGVALSLIVIIAEFIVSIKESIIHLMEYSTVFTVIFVLIAAAILYLITHIVVKNTKYFK